MPNACILTDSTVQFTRPEFPGRERVHVISFSIKPGSWQQGDSRSQSSLTYPQLVVPAAKEFVQHYTVLSREYDSILVLGLSSQLSPFVGQALSASTQFNNHAAVRVVDSLTTAVGLGLLVQFAAGAASAGASLVEIEQRLRAAMLHLYTLFCIPELTCLAQTGHVGFAQAVVGEMMELLPVFATEEGQLVPMEKARTPRHLFEIFQDFVSEFESPTNIALMRGINHTVLRALPLRQFVRQTFPETQFSEHSLSPHLTALFGSQSIGLFVMEALE